MKINPWKKNFKIGILENKFAQKLILFKQSNLFPESSLIQSWSLTKISIMILTQFQATLQFLSPKNIRKLEVKRNRRGTLVENRLLFHWN